MNSLPSFKLILNAEAGLSGAWEFSGPKSIVIGRDHRCVIHPQKTAGFLDLSRFHAVIDWDGKEALLHDLGSLGGTWLNCHLTGRRQNVNRDSNGGGVIPARNGEGVRLSDGDLISLGPLWLRVNVVDCENGGLQTASQCPGCGKNLPHVTTLSSPDALCETCRPNPLAALKLLQVGLKRRINALNSLKYLKVEKILGKGATSAVFLVTNKKTGQRSALKVMPPSVANNNWARKSFLREASLGRALKHENVVSLYEYGNYANTHYVLMEYCPGGSSEEERIQAGGQLSLERALSIILPVLDGLDFLHNIRLSTNITDDNGNRHSTVGLIHRDIKPANIFMGGEDGLTPKIADIGVAKFYAQGGSCDTRTGAIAGSPATMPRQQAMDFKNARAEADVWAAAASLYKLITGQYPRDFPADTDPWLVVMNKKPRPLLELLPDAPQHFAQTLDLALVDDPVIHHQTAAELKKALLQAIEADDIWV